MKHKILPLILIGIISSIFLIGCSDYTISRNKFYVGVYANLTPISNNTYYVGNSTHYWAGGYFTNLTVGSLSGNITFSDAYDDLAVSMSTIRPPASNAPNWVAYKGSELPAFSKSTTNTLYFASQLTHQYKEGSDLEFHIHIAYPNNAAGNSTWYMTYSWANMGGTFPLEGNSGNVIAISPTTTDSHQLVQLIPTISGAGKTISSVLLCSISRLGGDGGDNYDNVIYLTSCDFHYKKDTLGSKTATAK